MARNYKVVKHSPFFVFIVSPLQTTFKGKSSFQTHSDFLQWESFLQKQLASIPASSALRRGFQTCQHWKQIFMEIIGKRAKIARGREWKELWLTWPIWEKLVLGADIINMSIYWPETQEMTRRARPHSCALFIMHWTTFNLPPMASRCGERPLQSAAVSCHLHSISSCVYCSSSSVAAHPAEHSG